MEGKQQLLGSMGSLCCAGYYKYYIRNISETTHYSSWPRTFKPQAWNRDSAEEAGVGASPVLQAKETKTRKQPLVLAASEPKGSAPVRCRGETLRVTQEITWDEGFFISLPSGVAGSSGEQGHTQLTPSSTRGPAGGGWQSTLHPPRGQRPALEGHQGEGTQGPDCRVVPGCQLQSPWDGLPQHSAGCWGWAATWGPMHELATKTCAKSWFLQSFPFLVLFYFSHPSVCRMTEVTVVSLKGLLLF